MVRVHGRLLLVITLLLSQMGLGILVIITHSSQTGHVSAAGSHNIAVGAGFTDVSPHQLVRTSGDFLYTVAPTCDAYPACPGNTLRLYRADQPGAPSSFSEQDSAHRPTAVGSAALAIDGADTLHVLWNDRTGTINYRTFSTATNLWSATTVVAPTGWTDFGQGDEGVALAVDSNGMPHAVWSAKGSDGRLHVFYGNRGGSWSAQQVDDMALAGNRRALHPTIAFTAANTLIVCWLEGTFNYTADGIIRLRTRDVNGAWGATETINDPDGAMTTIDNGPSLLITPDGTRHLTFLAATPADQVRYWYNSGAGWQGDRQPPAQVTHNPSLGPDGSGGVYLYGHGTPAPTYQDHGDNLYSFHKGAGGAWEPWTLYVTGSYDSSVTTRWAQFSQAHPEEVDIAYWGDAYPNLLYIGTDRAAGAPTPTATPTATVTPAATATAVPATPTSTATDTPVATATATVIATATNTPVPTSTPTPPPTATSIPLPPTATPTMTPVPPTATATRPPPTPTQTPTATSTPGSAGVSLVGDQRIEPNQDSNPAGLAEAFQYIASAGGAATRLSIYVDGTNTASAIVVGLYTNTAGNAPGTLLAQGTIASPTKGAWNSAPIPSVAITTGATYWIAILGPSGSKAVQFRDTGTGGKAQTSKQANLTALPATWTAGKNYNNAPMSAYAG